MSGGPTPQSRSVAAQCRAFPSPGSLLDFFFFLNFIGIELMCNVVLVSGILESDSVIRIHASVLLQFYYLYRLLQSIEWSSLHSAVGPY